MEKWRQCSASNPEAVNTINCITSDLLPSCRSCVCTLLCYWSPTDELCRSCLNQPDLATLFLHHQHCPQGWVYSLDSSTCLKAFHQEKPWKYAKSFCQNGGGLLAQPKSVSTIQTVLEAIKSVEDGMFWLGGTENSIIDFIMSQNYPGHYENDYNQVIILN